MEKGFLFSIHGFLSTEKSYAVSYVGDKRRLTIPSEHDGVPVTVIGSICGEMTKNGDKVRVSSIQIPDSVTTIMQMAFAQCTELKKIVIPKSVTEIGSGAFPKDSIKKIYFADCEGWTISYNGKTEDVPNETLQDPEKAADYYKFRIMWSWKKR